MYHGKVPSKILHQLIIPTDTENWLTLSFIPFDRSDSGFQLLVCSWDGTVAYADFTEEELGRPMSEEEKVQCTLYFSHTEQLLPSKK